MISKIGGVLLKNFVIPIAIKVIKQVFTEENYQKYGDRAFDLLEDFIADTETKIDDQFLPLVQGARAMMGIPDFPDE